MPPSCPPAVVDLVGASDWELVPGHDRHGQPIGPNGAPTPPAGGADDPGESGQDTVRVGGTPARIDRWAPIARWRVGDHRVALAPTEAVAAAEAARITWLSRQLSFDGPPGAGAPVAGLVVLREKRWLVTEGPPGEPADQPERHPEPDRVPGLIGAALRALHQLDPATCPFTRPLADELAELAAAAGAGRIDPSRLPPPYDRYRPDELIRLAGTGPMPTRSPGAGAPGTAGANRDGAAARPDDQVVGHGRPLAGHVLVAPTGPSGLLALDRLAVMDRHRDLAVAHRQLQTLFGGEAVFAFYDGYGLDPDLVGLDRGVLLDVLDAAVAPPAARAERGGEPVPRVPR